MNAKELETLVNGWPVEARPKGLTWVSGYPQVDFFNRGCEYDQGALHPDHAIVLHVASGLEYLIGEGYHSFIFDCGDTDATAPSLSLYDDIKVHGKTTFDLIHAAIIATQGEKQ